MKEARLPAGLLPNPCADLIRLGRDNDGGYLASRADVMATDCLVGLGVNDDWSFEEHFTQVKPCSVICYDASVGAAIFLMRYLEALAEAMPSTVTRKRARTLLGYLKFFRGRHLHVRRFVAKWPNAKTVGFNDVVRRIGKRRAFLKIDIEGSEYGLLDAIVAIAPQLTGLVIEFHSCSRHMEKVLRFVDQVGLQLVHVHVNNCGSIANDGIPTPIELTFSSHTPAGSRLCGLALPHPLDQPNSNALPDIAVRFDDPSFNPFLT